MLIIIHLILLLFFLLQDIKGIEEEYIDKLNDFITISKNQEIKIKVKSQSIAYFDSIDQNSIISIESEKGTKKRIEGQFLTLEEEIIYTIIISLYNSETPSILQRYVYPYNLTKDTIDIQDNEINYLYLIQDTNTTLNFEKNTINKIITLSRKTFEAKIIIYTNNQMFELNKNNLYYVINSNYKGILILETKESNGFIQFLSSSENDTDHMSLMASSTFNNYKIEFNTLTLFIPYTEKEIEIQLTSPEAFQYSFSNGYSLTTLYYWYYYNSTFNNKIDAQKKDNNYIASLKFYKLFGNINLIDKEYFVFTIGINLKTNKNVFINYNQFSQIDDLMDEAIDEIYCNNIKKNFHNLFELYVYTDIAKNPPKNIKGYPNYHHEKINIEERLAKIKTTNRYFYEFYQEIETIIGAVKDRHLIVYSIKTPKGISLKKNYVNLPFDFIIKEHDSQYRIFIKKNNYYNKYDKTFQKVIDDHLQSPLKRINGIDPFSYIQNWSKFKGLKNPHAQFTKRISEISHFYLYNHPLNYSELSLNEYEFEDDNILRIPYYFEVKNVKDLKFNNYFLNVIKAEDTNEVPSIEEIYNNYLIFKGEKKQQLRQIINSNFKIDWNSDLSYFENNNKRFIKCRVDDINKVNVIYQNSFSFDYTGRAISKIIKCVKMFYSNNYPIIIIESQNRGGKVVLYSVLLQILQPKIEFKDYRSYRITPLSEEYLKTKQFRDNINTLDCSAINSYQDIKNFIEDSYGDSSIHHNRTYPHDPIDKSHRLALRELRKELLNNGKYYKKKPTDIIIFTDSYSFSATSGLIKGFQNTGSAVTVGFFGNPKIEGTDLFDASQSSSTTDKLEYTKVKGELKKYGFIVDRITFAESYNFHQINVKDQIPREYSLDPIDFRFNFYSDYSDEKYDDFIKEGLKIHKMLNEDKKCNSKNDILFLDDDKCSIIEGDVYAHGGYKCGSDNLWDTSKCKPYYCDLGYYFDQVQKKCVKNCQFEDEKGIFIYEDNYEKIFDDGKNVKYTFIFLFYPGRKYFSNIISNGLSKKKPITSSITSIEKQLDSKLEIKEVKTSLKLLNLDLGNTKYSFFKKGEN